jgi:hypothetical protein
MRAARQCRPIDKAAGSCGILIYNSGVSSCRTLVHRLAPLAFLLVLMAFAGRLMAPAGYMPMAGPDGVQLVLCSGGTPPGSDTSPHAPTGEDDCAFAVAAAHGDAPLSTTTLVMAPADHSIALAMDLPPSNLGSGIGDHSQPATGPPALA